LAYTTLLGYENPRLRTIRQSEAKLQKSAGVCLTRKGDSALSHRKWEHSPPTLTSDAINAATNQYARIPTDIAGMLSPQPSINARIRGFRMRRGAIHSHVDFARRGASGVGARVSPVLIAR
jgi:hypothetical protein